MKKIKYIPVALYILIFIFIIIAEKFELLSEKVILSLLLAAVFNVFNLLGAVVAFRFSINKSNQIFILYNLGGMTARMFILLLAILISLKFLNIDKDGFILLFFIFYFAQIIAEIGYFSNYLKRTKRN